MTVIEWILGIVGTVIAGSVIYMGKIISSLPRDYVPRQQIDSRFRDLEGRLHNDMQSQKADNAAQFDRMYGEFDKLHGKIDKMIDKLDGKADRH